MFEMVLMRIADVIKDRMYCRSSKGRLYVLLLHFSDGKRMSGDDFTYRSSN